MRTNFIRVLIAVLCIAALLTGCTKDAAPESKASKPDASQQEGEGGPDAEGDGQSYSFTQNEDGTLTLTAYHGSGSTLYIPSALDGKAVSEIGESCFAGQLCLKKVHVPDGVERIGDYAFECCSLLEKVYLPESLKAIGDGAFSGCSSLSLVDLQDGVESIGAGAFLCCDSLVQLELPAALTEIGAFAFAGCAVLASVQFRGSALAVLPDRVFYGCTSLSRLRLPESVSAIGKRAFSHCEGLKSLYFATPLTDLGACAFEDCAQLSSVDLASGTIPAGLFSSCSELSWFSVPEGTERIECGAFGNSGISTVSIPASVKEIEPGAFFQMPGNVTLDEGNEAYRLIDGSLYTADGKTLLAFFPADPYAEEPQTAFTVPEGVKVIASYALSQKELTEVVLPASLLRIDAYAFAGTYPEDLQLPEGVEVDPDAFRYPGESAEEPDPDESGEMPEPEVIGSVAGGKSLFKEEDFADFREIGNDEFDAWCSDYLAYNEAQGISLCPETIPYVLRYKGEVVPHFMPMTAVQNRDPTMWEEAAEAFGDDFEEMYLMMDHGLATELSRGRMKDDLILFSGLYDSQLMAAAGTDALPTQQQLVDAIGSTFTDPIMISTTTDPGIAANFGDTLFIIYASQEAMEGLGAVCIDAVAHSQEKEILMNSHAQYRILDVGNMKIERQDPWEEAPTTLYRAYVKVELLVP